MGHGRYLIGPDGLRVDVITVDDAQLTLARNWCPEARKGQQLYLVTRHGALLVYCADIEELTEVVGDLSQLHGPAAGEDVG